MDSKFYLLILMQVLASVEQEPSQNYDEIDIRRRPRKDERDNDSGNSLHQLQSKLQDLQPYSKFGAHLEKMLFYCESESFRELKTAITDLDQPVDVKLMAIVVLSIGIRCKETALWVGRILRDVHEKNERDITIQDAMSGPIKNLTLPCNFETAKYIRNLFRSRDRLTFLYHISSSSFFLKLGCHELGKNLLQYLYQELNVNNTMQNSADRNMMGEGFKRGISPLRKNEQIMNYIYKHKSDIQKYQQVEQLVDDTNQVTLSENSKTVNERKRRNAGNQIIYKYFSLQRGCSIESPLGITLMSVTKSTCLQFCLDQESCRSVGYKNEKSNLCQLNTEVEKEVGNFFSCGKSNTTEYYEKKKDIVYFLISSKLNAAVLTAVSEQTVKLEPFNEDNITSQLWFWQDDAIHSKQFPSKTLTAASDLISLKSTRDLPGQRWYFENEALTSQFNNLRLDIQCGGSNIFLESPQQSSPAQKWSLNLDRFYFVIICRRSGKVLNVNHHHTSKDKVVTWSYHGGDNQLWFWDDDSIRSKMFPDKVLDLHCNDYERYGRGKVYLHSYHGGNNQRWKVDGDEMISLYNNLRLDEADHSTAGRSDVTGYVRTGNTDQRWTFGSIRTYFFILNKRNGRVIDATSSSEIKLWHYIGDDKQLWFWDGDVIRNKKYQDKVIDFNVLDFERYSHGKLFLNSFQGNTTQMWKYNKHILFSTYKNLSVQVDKPTPLNGTMLQVSSEETDNWSLTPVYDFFTITTRQDTKVLHVVPQQSSKVVMWTFNGSDNQFWFWDDDSLRSKKFPHKVLELEKRGWRVKLSFYHGGANQKWKKVGEELISAYRNFRLDIIFSRTRVGAEVGGFPRNRKLNQMWAFNSKFRVMFTIKSVESGKVLDVKNDFDVVIQTYHGGDNQLWYWDENSIRSKKYPDKVLHLDMVEFNREGWGKVYLHTYNGGENQEWEINDNRIISNFRKLYLDVFNSNTYNGAKVGAYPRTDNDNQKWVIAAVEASTGHTVATGGAAVGASNVGFQAGLNQGLKIGLKQGIKTAVSITKQSIKNMVKIYTKKFADSGIRQAILNGIKKAGKLVIKEAIVDSALFYKNIGKISTTFLTHPKLTLKQAWKEALNGIDNLKKLIKELEELRQVSKKGDTHIPCRRSPTSLFCCCFVPEGPKLGYTNKQRTRYEQLLSGDKQPVSISVCARRYMTLEADSLKIDRRRIDNIMSGLQTEVEKAEVYAIYKYTKGSINRILHDILKTLPINNQLTKEQVDSIFYQASLMQNYLKRNSMNQRVTVYRFEKNVMADVYRKNEIYIPKMFISTTKINERFSTGIPLNNKTLYPIELEIKLKYSGTDISSLSAYPTQQEVLLPAGVKFRVRKKEKITEDGINIVKVALDEI